jgi:hypothetical protein
MYVSAAATQPASTLLLVFHVVGLEVLKEMHID